MARNIATRRIVFIRADLRDFLESLMGTSGSSSRGSYLAYEREYDVRSKMDDVRTKGQKP